MRQCHSFPTPFYILLYLTFYISLAHTPIFSGIERWRKTSRWFAASWAEIVEKNLPFLADAKPAAATKSQKASGGWLGGSR